MTLDLYYKKKIYIYFLGLFLREASHNEDCNTVRELESHNLYLFLQAVQI